MSSAEKTQDSIRFAVIGYGPSFNMAPRHIDSIHANEGFELCGICDVSEACLAAARERHPECPTFTSADVMLAEAKPDLVVIITPHNTHAPLGRLCLEAGAHVVTEKPMAITTEEVAGMIEVAKKRNLMLSVFHNRRWDADFMVLQRLVESGIIGRIFRIEAAGGGYGKQRDWWRAHREISGGAIYDWGAHFVDWILNLVPSRILAVSGFQVKHPDWQDYTNEDHSELTLRFVDDCLVTLTISNMSAAGKPRWRILGLNGAIVAGDGAFEVSMREGNRTWQTRVPFSEAKSDWDAYYRNVCAHLRDGEPLSVTPESAARVISVLDCANRSAAANGVAQAPEFD